MPSPTVEPDDEPLEGIEHQDYLRDRFVKIEMEHQRQKDWHRWNQLPYWEKYEFDHTNGLDDGNPPARYANSHPEEYDLSTN